MQVYLTVIAAVAAILAIAAILGKRNEMQAEKNFRAAMKRKWGEEPNLDIKEGRMSAIPKYFERHKTKDSIDDITWNDLGMDAVYERLNYCRSGAGQEYLYYRLRTPEQTDDFETEEKHIRNFAENEKLRIDCQMIFAKMANYGKYSLYDYMDFIDDLKASSNMPHIVMDLLLVISIVGCFVKFELFFLAALLILVIQVIQYFRIKGDIAPYLSTFSYILRMLDGVALFHGIKDEALLDETNALREDEKKMASFRRGSWILLAPTMMSNTGDPLSMLLDYFCMVTHLDLIKFNTMVRTVRGQRDSIDHMVTVLGHIETEISIACYRASIEDGYCIPSFNAKGVTSFTGKELYHPCMKSPIKNTIETDRGVLITGSNASGKSTFLKICAISAVMAQAVHTVLGSEYAAPMYRIYSSMALRDDLVGGDSYYIVEIKSLKRILDAAEEDGNRILCLIDEVLRGTNTIERIAASTQILKSLHHQNIQSFAATHDVELTELLKEDYDNYHFDGLVTDSDVHFTYELKKGPATTRNAIKLLSIMGYDKEIVEEAQTMAEDFSKTGIWKMA